MNEAVWYPGTLLRDESGGLWRAGTAPTCDDIEKILDVGVTIHVGIRCTQVKRGSQFIEIAGIDSTVGIHVAGRSRCDAEVRHSRIGIVNVVVAIAVEVADDRCLGDITTTYLGFGLQWIVRAAVDAIRRTVGVGVGIQWIFRTDVASIGRAIAVRIGIVVIAWTLIQVIGNAVTIRVYAFISHVVVAGIGPWPIDLIEIITAHKGVDEGGVAQVVAVDPAALLGRVARNRAAADCWTAGVVADDPAAALPSRVAHDRAVADGGVAAAAAVDPAAVAVDCVAPDRAPLDGDDAFAAEDPTAVGVGRVVRDRAIDDGGVGLIAEDPAAVGGLVALNYAPDDGGVAIELAEDPAAEFGRVARDRAVADGGAAVAVAVDTAAVGT